MDIHMHSATFHTETHNAQAEKYSVIITIIILRFMSDQIRLG